VGTAVGVVLGLTLGLCLAWQPTWTTLRCDADRCDVRGGRLLAWEQRHDTVELDMVTEVRWQAQRVRSERRGDVTLVAADGRELVVVDGAEDWAREQHRLVAQFVEQPTESGISVRSADGAWGLFCPASLCVLFALGMGGAWIRTNGRR